MNKNRIYLLVLLTVIIILFVSNLYAEEIINYKTTK
jgi:hypothetical protein